MTAGLAAATLLATAVPALADGPFGSVDCEQNPRPACQLEAGDGGNNSDGGGNDSGSGRGGASDATGNLDCGGPLDPLCSLNGAIQNGVPSPADVARQARSQLRLPSPGIAANPAGDQLVNLPTWLWLSDGWSEESATASVPGVSVTAVAKPTAVSWAMGDGTVVTCSGPGTPYRPGVDPRLPSPDCGHTFRRSSAAQPGQGFPVTATIRWSVSWSGAGQSGVFPALTTTATTRFRVVEAPALVTG